MDNESSDAPSAVALVRPLWRPEAPGLRPLRLPCAQLQVIFRISLGSTDYRAVLRKITYENKAPYDSTPSCITHSVTVLCTQFCDSFSHHFAGCKNGGGGRNFSKVKRLVAKWIDSQCFWHHWWDFRNDAKLTINFASWDEPAFACRGSHDIRPQFDQSWSGDSLSTAIKSGETLHRLDLPQKIAAAILCSASRTK